MGTSLRVLEFKAVDSITVEFTFNQNLISTISAENITIESLNNGVLVPTITKIVINTNVLTIKSTPLTPYALYKYTLSSTQTSPFTSVNGNYLIEDGNSNCPIITGTYNPENEQLDKLIYYYKNTPHNTDSGTITRTYLEGIADVFYKAYNTINQLRTDNYLSITVEDEAHTRGKGPYDRLNNEGAYEIIRVGPNTSDAVYTGSKLITKFPKEPVSLQSKSITNEQLTVSAVVGTSKTFTNNICTVDNNNIIKLTRLVIFYGGSGTTYEYDLDAYGYQIQDSRYDKNASTYVDLETNQFKFSEKAISNGFVLPVSGDYVIVSYDYKDLGICVKTDSIKVSKLNSVIREIAPPIATIFSLNHSSIVNSIGNEITTGGITFLDPKATPPFSATHPAFAKEVAYSSSQLPNGVGLYSVDYTNGKVYVYGSSTLNNDKGTGSYPPVCTYYYKKYYSEKIQYAYESSLMELAAIRSEELLYENNILVEYEYTQNYVPNVDYEAQVHTEVLNERILNRLSSTNVIYPEFTPITNVFRIYNETSGEVYSINRFDDNKIIFNYNNAPTFINSLYERVQFKQISDEVMLSSETLTNTSLTIIFKITLNNNKIAASTEDCIGASFNTSFYPSEASLFSTELYYDPTATLSSNLDKLTMDGQYVVDYFNGIVYLAVSSSNIQYFRQCFYKTAIIVSQNDHIISVSDIYSRIDLSSDKIHYNYFSFSDTEVVLTDYEYADNKYFDAEQGTLYYVTNNTLPLPVNAKGVRSVYDITNINSEESPINFAVGSTTSLAQTTLAPVNFQMSSVIGFGNTVSVPYLITYPNFEMASVVYIKRFSDGYELYNTLLNDGSFTGSTITLPTDTLGSFGQSVEISINIQLVDGTAVIVDLDLGGLYIDYTYLFDEILISYEYGDNVIDFRNSTTVDENSTYYVSYKYGALRDALISNFGSIVNIDELRNFDVDLVRERYRDALMACLQSFPKGPTIQAISEIAKKISHVDPEIIESMFEEWVIGTSFLFDKPIDVIGGAELVPSKWDYGVRIAEDGYALRVPLSSHIKLDKGTMEFWLTPDWNGIANDATLNFKIYLNNTLLPKEYIFIGENSENPETLTDGSFNLNRITSSFSCNGLPYNYTIDGYGAFIFYNTTSNHWNCLFTGDDGYVYDSTITTSGEFYNVTSVDNLLGPNDILRTSKTKILSKMVIDSDDGYGLSFVSDDIHYILDSGEDQNENRISLFKDGSGYLVLRVYSKKDRFNKPHAYQLSYDISSWEAGEPHHIAITTKINSKEHRDELHLFIDGEEVPNIIRFGGRPIVNSIEAFRTVVPEIVVGVVPANTISGNDMITTIGSDIVSSTGTDFPIEGALVGDTIYIDELGFALSYAVLNIIDANTLQLSSVMPASLTNVKYSINKWTVPISIEAMYDSNLLVTRYYLDGLVFVEKEIPGLRADVPGYSISVDAYGQASICVEGYAKAGDQIFIRTLGLNHRRANQIVYVWGSTSNVINLNLPSPINLDYTKVYAVNKSKYIFNTARRSMGYDGYVSETIVGNDITTTGILPDTQPSSSTGGRTLSVSITGSNVNFINPVVILIKGTTYSGAVSEAVSFSAVGTKQTLDQFKTITSIDAAFTMVNPSKPGIGFEIKEYNQITYAENDGYAPILRYSRKENATADLDGYSGNTITSTVINFYSSQVGKTLVITSPVGAAGSYTIDTVVDQNTITISPALPISFTNGAGSIYNISIIRSGFANGLFAFEYSGISPTLYLVKQGFYDFDYQTYLEIPFDIKSNYLYIGNAYTLDKPANATFDEFRALDVMLTDTRIGETASSLGSITSDYNSYTPFDPDSHTTLLLHMDESPPVDSSIPYERFSKEYFQSDYGLNADFNESLCINNYPLEINNNRVLYGNSGTIEYWINPDFDTRNDFNERYMFDANSSIIEEVVSLTKRTITIKNRAKEIIAVKLINDKDSNSKDYYNKGSLSADGKTITLGLSLPFQNTTVKVVYIPIGAYGNRISIYKDENNNCIFRIISNNKTYALKSPILWARDTWHRVMATWDLSKANFGQMHLFIDGEEHTLISAGQIVAGSGIVAGAIATRPLTNLNISIKDQFQKLYIGGTYLGGNLMMSKIDNLKISRNAKSPVYISGQPFDNDYNTNTESVLPVVDDLYTTYLMNADKYINKIEDFTILKNSITGIYDFTLNVFDSFDIIGENERVKSIFETLIKRLKPAQSRAFINYTK